MADTSGNSSGQGDGSSYPPAGGASWPPPPPPGGQAPSYPSQQTGGYPAQQPPEYSGSYGAQQPPPGYGGYPPPPPAYPGGGYGNEFQGKTGKNGFAIAAFVTGLIPWVGILFAIPLGIVALVKISKSRQTGKILAIVGMVIAVLYWAATIAFGVILAANTAERDSSGQISESGRIDFTDIRTGDCVDIDDIGGSGEKNLFDIKGVPCSESHNVEAVGEVTFDDTTYPGYTALTDDAQKDCFKKATKYVDPAKAASLQPYLFAPTEALWKDDSTNHKVVCFVTQTDLSSTTGSVAK